MPDPLRELILDQYAPLSHKAPVGTTANAALGTLWSWVRPEDRRRLAAYVVLEAYRSNNGRWHIADCDEVERAERREYGDAGLLCSRVAAGVLGDQLEIVVDGGNLDLPDAPELPDRPDELGDGADEIDQRIFAARQARWAERANQVVDEWERQWADLPGLQERQQWLRDWADDELLVGKLIEAEADTVALGDGVYVLAWSPAKQRTTVTVYDADGYFPVLDGVRPGDYPTRVHLAWEYWEGTGQERHRRVRRLTWELVDLNVAHMAAAVNAAGPRARPEEVLAGFQSRLAESTSGNGLTAADRTRDDGTIERSYGWNVDDAGQVVPSTVTCVFSDASWSLTEVGPNNVADLDPAKARWELTEDGQLARQVDLLIDFLPVLHTPNTPSSKEHYGRSVLLLVAQILDDLSTNDSDYTKAARFCGGPVVSLSGATMPDVVSVRPGMAFNLGKDGQMSVLDLSQGMTALKDREGRLLERLSVNGQVPEEVLGRAAVAKDASGISILLRFGPFTQLVGTLRIAREPKYQLLLKHCQRIAMAGGALPVAPPVPARLAFGSFLPGDLASLVEQVTKLLTAHAISTQTAVELLVGGGMSIEDARGEVQRIRYENPKGAHDIAEATASEELAAEWLGVDLPAAPAPPATGFTPPAQ